MLTSKEHYDLMEQFEKEYNGFRLDREDKALWMKGHIYQHGHTNDTFIAYRNGYSLGKAVERQNLA